MLKHAGNTSRLYYRRFSINGIGNTDVVARDSATKTKIVRMNQSHIPLVLPAFTAFATTETTVKSLGIVPKPDTLLAMLYNSTRYPYSYFTVDKSGKVVCLALQEVIYRDPRKDPVPRIEVPIRAGDDFAFLGGLMDFAEQRMFELKPELNKMIHYEVAWTDPNYRCMRLGHRIASVAMNQTMEEGLSAGFAGAMGMVTSIANRGNMAKVNFEILETLPSRAYILPKGKEFSPPEGRATLVFLDYQKAMEKRYMDELTYL